MSSYPQQEYYPQQQYYPQQTTGATPPQKSDKCKCVKWVTPAMWMWLIFVILLMLYAIFTVGCGFCSVAEALATSSFDSSYE